MSDSGDPLLIKRYASRRLYNTETSDYVTLDDIAKFIRDGRDVQIIDLKSGDDLTRQYLLQIIAEPPIGPDQFLIGKSRLALTRSRRSLPGLKCGTCFPGSATDSPVFGFRPMRGAR